MYGYAARGAAAAIRAALPVSLFWPTPHLHNVGEIVQWFRWLTPAPPKNHIRSIEELLHLRIDAHKNKDNPDKKGSLPELFCLTIEHYEI